MSQNTSINGIRYDFTTVNLKSSTSGGSDFQFPKGVLQSLDYDAAQDAGLVQGNQISLVGRTNGYGVGTGSMEILISEFDDWVSNVTNNGQTPLMSVFFNLVVQFSVNAIDVRTDTLQGIKITKVTHPNKKGNDAITVTCDLSIAQIFSNGIAMFGDPAQ